MVAFFLLQFAFLHHVCLLLKFCPKQSFFALRVGNFDCDVASICNTGWWFLVRLFALRLHKWLCVVPQQPAGLHSRRNLQQTGCFVCCRFFYTRIGAFALHKLDFVDKEWRLWFVGLVSTIIVLPSIPFCNSVAGVATWLFQIVVFGTRGCNFAVKVAKKSAMPNLALRLVVGFLFC